jgi:hypothetical protein
MSGGAFDYDQYRLGYIADTIEDRIKKNNEKPEYWWGDWNGQVYPDEVIEEYKKAIAYLKIALCYAQRVDWILSGDDGNDSFMERLQRDLEKLKEYDEYGYIKKILEK